MMGDGGVQGGRGKSVPMEPRSSEGREPPPSVCGGGAEERFLFRPESGRSRKRPARSRPQLAQTEGFFFFPLV